MFLWTWNPLKWRLWYHKYDQTYERAGDRVVCTIHPQRIIIGPLEWFYIQPQTSIQHNGQFADNFQLPYPDPDGADNVAVFYDKNTQRWVEVENDNHL